MGIDLTAVNADPDAGEGAKHCWLAFETGGVVFDLSDAAFFEGETATRNQASEYAERVRAALADGEFERVYAENRCTRSIEDVREQVESYAYFAEHCGGYTMWV